MLYICKYLYVDLDMYISSKCTYIYMLYFELFLIRVHTEIV